MPVPQFETSALSGTGQPRREFDRFIVSRGVKNSLAEHFAGLAQEAESVHAHEIGPPRSVLLVAATDRALSLIN
jgi:hypothetical protein